MENVQVSKIVIKIKDKEIELSLDEAKELKEILAGLFRKKEDISITYPTPIYPYYPYVEYRWDIWKPYVTYTGTARNSVAYYLEKNCIAGGAI